MMKIAVAMSGGVDSSVAAALLKKEGHEVIGLTMQLLPANKSADSGPDAVESARQVARKLGIPHYVADFRDIFTRIVIDDFCREYGLGRTPNPCVLCNHHIKFGALWEKAAEMGAEYIATGHYARIERKGNVIQLKKGVDTKKDQSYFLCRLTHEQLQRAMFPVGHLTKMEVRQIAREREIPAASRPESQEICFIPDHDYAGFVKDYLCASSKPGPILDCEGNFLGEHRGITDFTIGQRHGLGIAAARPLYVTGIAPDRNAVIVGFKEQTYVAELVAGEMNWISMDPPQRKINVKARIRYRHPEAEATVTPVGDEYYHVNFTVPQMAVTPGQTIAFYDGDIVIGGGIIIRQGR